LFAQKRLLHNTGQADIPDVFVSIAVACRVSVAQKMARAGIFTDMSVEAFRFFMEILSQEARRIKIQSPWWTCRP